MSPSMVKYPISSSFPLPSEAFGCGFGLRWKHSARMGSYRLDLEEMAHQPEREAAQERRKKEKNRKLAKKQKKEKSGGGVASEDDVGGSDDVVHGGESDFGSEDMEHDDDENDSDPSLPDVAVVKEKMMETARRFEESLKAIRGAEPTPEMFEHIQVNAYGSSMTPLKSVAQVVITSPTLAQISCFDPTVAKQVQKAIQMALQTMNPQLEEGGIIKVPIPKVSMETRKETAKQLQQKAETCRQRVRHIRRKAMDVVKKGIDGKLEGVSKDDAFATSKDLEQVTDSVIKAVQASVDRKMEDIMAI